MHSLTLPAVSINVNGAVPRSRRARPIVSGPDRTHPHRQVVLGLAEAGEGEQPTRGFHTDFAGLRKSGSHRLKVAVTSPSPEPDAA
jgi:hypothetical protein